MPLFFWSLLTGGMGVLFLEVAQDPAQTSEARWIASVLFALSLLLGPVAFGVCMFRLCFIKVVVDSLEGLILPGRRTIPWTDIHSVAFHESPVRGLIKGSPVLHFITVGSMALLYYVVLPSLAFCALWPPRVIVGLRDGRQVVLRDLRRAAEFAKLAAKHVVPASGVSSGK